MVALNAQLRRLDLRPESIDATGSTGVPRGLTAPSGGLTAPDDSTSITAHR